MKAVIEFVGYFISKTGRKLFEIDFEGDEATVRELIIEAERAMINRQFEVIEDGELKKGVLVFCRKENGGMERVFKLDTLLNKTGENIVMANLMGGG